MKTSFEIIAAGFARHVLGNKVSGDPVNDAIRAIHMNHPLNNGNTSRLKKWAIFRESGSSIASELTNYLGGDQKTLREAFVGELRNFREPAVFAIFTNALLNDDNLRATYDIRRIAICSPGGIEIVNVADLESQHWLAREYRKGKSKNAA